MTKDEAFFRDRAASLKDTLNNISATLSFRGLLIEATSEWMLDEIQKVIDDAFEKERVAITKWQKGE